MGIGKDKIVYLIRHGESEDNAAPIYQRPESPLSEEGRQQARLIAERISKIDFEALISSPLARARETAEEITKLTGKDLEHSDLLVERIKPTNLNGRLHTDEEAKKLSKEWGESLYTPGSKVEDGENFDEIITRARKALDMLDSRPENSIVVVTHGFLLRTLITYVLFGDQLTGDIYNKFMTKTVTKNTGLSVLRYFAKDDAWKLWIYNDHAHLG